MGVHVFWNVMHRLHGKVGDLVLVPASFLGFAFVRRWSLWLVQFSSGTFVSTALFDGIVLLGNALAFLLFASLAWRRGGLLRSGWMLCGSAGILVAGSSVCLFDLGPVAVQAFGAAFASVGFSAMFLLWLELYGLLELRKMIVAYFGSMLLNTLLYAFLEGYDPAVAPWVILTFPVISLVCLLTAVLVRKVPRPDFETGESRLPVAPSTCKLLAWIAIFGLTYGMGDALTGMSTESSSIAGRTVFALAMLVGAVFFARRFTLRIVYRVVLPLMITGLAIVFFNANPWVSQAFMSAGMEGYQALALIVCCGMASCSRSSAAFLGGLAFAIETFSMQMGKMGLATAMSLFDVNTVFVGVCAILVLVVATTCLFKEGDLLESYSEIALRSLREDEQLAKKLSAYAAEHGFTDKEGSVFILMVRGRTIQEIADELYLAKSTVRVHMSKIYQKLGVHSREKFDERTRELG